MKRNLVAILIALTSVSAIAQRDANLYFLPAVHSNKLNPAFMPKAGTVLGLGMLPSVGFDLSNAFKLSDLTKQHETIADSLQYDFAGLANSLDGSGNKLDLKLDYDLFRIGFRMGPKKKTMVTLNVTEKILFKANYPKSLFEFIGGASGNSNVANVTLSDVDLDFTHYREWGFTFAREVNEKLNVGLGLKLLYGKGNLSTERTNISIVSGVNTPVTMSSDVLINMSGFNQLEKGAADYAQIVENTGVAFDLGGTYKVNDKLELSFSALDLGAGIDWKFDLETVQGDSSYTFTPADLTQSSNISDQMDSLLGVFEFDTLASAKSYKTTIPTKLNLAGNYTINDKLKAGALVNLELGDETAASFSLVGQYKVSHVFSAALSYGVYNGSASNIGLGFVLNGGPFQLYLGTDNITSFNLVGSKNANLRLGMAFQFGRTDKPAKKTQEKTKS